ncbi:DUF805 domain-containing protein [Phytoactinopolyspora halotolerans]|uniref:DUF805 domain-containing protein n=1 Tax=Phytoactinopolyspora halotolerans TaxID=1981512 RepID=A0A6L9SG12_9ACTN|nr:DUF805 domain-containing protein [Phytoactinopolyspora halotolerans]NEE03578.1 DUF805 domain-containing protein [Phytoactinopolyspora halotolerans]
MSALYPPEERRRLGRKYRWAAAALWFIVVFFGLAVLGSLAGDEAEGIRDDIDPVVAVLAGVLPGSVVVFALAVVHSRSAAWKRAARIGAAPLFMRGTIAEITHTRLASIVKIAIDGSTQWRFDTRDRNDTTSVPGDPVTIELYGTVGKVLGAYRNDRTGHVRAVGTRIPG